MGIREILGNLTGGVAGNIPGVGSSQSNDGFQQTLVNADFGLSANLTLATGKYTEYGKFTVGAQREYNVGSGGANDGAGRNQGFAYVKLITDITRAEIEGTHRIVISNANQTKRFVVLENRSEKFAASETDKDVALPIPEQVQFQRVGEDSLILLEFKPDGSSDVTFDYDATETKIRIPVTVYQ